MVKPLLQMQCLMFDVSKFTNENEASPTHLPPVDSFDLDEI